MKNIRRCLPLLAVMILSACATLFGAPTPTPTPAPTITPTPAPALSPERVWLSPDGLSDTVIAAGADGASLSIHLPLNNDQRASWTVGSPDGRYLAYLVWDAPDEQHGIATWLLTEPNARLVYQPLSNYRVVSLWISADSASLLFVEQEQGKLPEQADWRLQSMPLIGGTPVLLANADAQPDLLPPRPFGLLPDGSAIFNANTRYDVSSGKPLQADFILGPDGALSQASLPDDRVVGDGALSPDGTKLAYTVVPGAVPGGASGGSAGNVARVVTLTARESVTVDPPHGMTIASLAWMPDRGGASSGARLLFDLVASGEGDTKTQSWQVVTPGAASQPMPTSSDPARARLFNYLPFGSKGVAYTLLPAAGEMEWQLYLMPDITTDSAPRPIVLGRIDPNVGPPRVIRAP